MILKRAILLTIAAVLAILANAAPLFHTKLHAKIAEKTGIDIPDTIGFNQNNDSTWYYKGHALRIRTNAHGEISHIGYKLFNNQLIAAYQQDLLINFLERYLLELDLKIDEKSPAERMDIDRVICTSGNISMLKMLKQEAPISIETIERRMYRVTCNIGIKKLCIIIPADYQLLIGANAIELENIFENGIKKTKAIKEDDSINEWADINVSEAGDYLVANSDRYLSEMIRSDIYLIEKEGKRTLLIDKKNPLQSVRNIMLTGCFKNDIPMTMTLNRYGYKSTKTRTTLQQFVKYCNMDGCKLYFGIKNKNKDSIKGTLFALNKSGAYNHILSVNVPLSILEDGTGTIESTAYAYIPLQNVTENFFTEGLTK